MHTEADLLPLSGLQHLLYCERRAALVHLEHLWEENLFTAEGRVMHERVHEVGAEQRGSVRVARGLRIRSLRLGLIGQADVVEFHRCPDGARVPVPIEYKRGKPKANRCDEVQLCAQALCLEEMLQVQVPRGALFYGRSRRRTEVAFDTELRQLTEQAAARLHELIRSRLTPAAVYEKKCDTCSLFAVCLPKSSRRAAEYVAKEVFADS